MPKFLVPVIGILLAVVVGVGATLFGVQFAAPHTLATEAVPILAPINQNGLDNGDPTTRETSDIAGMTTIVSPGQQGTDGLGAELEADISLLNGLDGASAEEAYVTLRTTPRAPALVTDDPCAPSSGETPSDCPSGLHSIILADSMPPELYVWPVVDRTTERSPAPCPAATVPAHALRVGVTTSVPATVTVTYGPRNDHSADRTLVMETPQSEIDAWDAANAAVGGFRHDYPVFGHCGFITELIPNTVYSLKAIAVDVFGRLAGPADPGDFNSDGSPTEPLMTAIPLSQNLLYVSVPSRPSQENVLVRAWVVPEGTVPDCQSFDAGFPALRTVQDQVTLDVGPLYILAHNYQSAYSLRTVNVYSVPEGSNAVVCARFFGRGTTPSWTGSAEAQRSIAVSSPDSPQPILTLLSVETNHDVPSNTISITASTPMGLDCGSAWTGPADNATGGSTIDAGRWPVCDASLTGDSFRAQLSLGRYIVLTNSVQAAGVTTRSSFVIPTPQTRCTGRCELPAPALYRIHLADPNLGTALVELSWAPGGTSGLEQWAFGGIDTRPAGSPAPDAPTFESTITPFLSPDGFSAGVDVVIQTDRHAVVQFRASTASECDSPLYRGQRGEFEAVPSTTDPAVFSTTFRLTDLCPGKNYIFQAVLTDDAGNLTYADAIRQSDPDNFVYWPEGHAYLPYNSIPLTTRVTIDAYQSTPDLAAPYKLTVADQAYRCQTAGDSSVELTWDRAVVQQGTVHISIPISVNRRDTAESGPVGSRACQWDSEGIFSGTLSADVSYADLVAGTTLSGFLTQGSDGVRVPEGFYATVHVQWPGIAAATRVG